jgi:hypothetical protein
MRSINFSLDILCCFCYPSVRVETVVLKNMVIRYRR